MAILQVDSVYTGYGKIEIIHSINMTVHNNQCVGVFGPNGHGKTTLLNAISGILPITQGSILFDGVDISHMPAHKIVNMGIVQSPQGNTLFGHMGVAETLEMSAFCPHARPKMRKNLDYVYTLFPPLAQRRSQRVNTMSGGERQMVSIAVALMCEPRLLILDEPTLGLSPKLKKQLGLAIEKIATGNRSMIIVEQDVEFLLRLSQSLHFIEHGEIVQSFDAQNTLDNSHIKKLYFGEG